MGRGCEGVLRPGGCGDVLCIQLKDTAAVQVCYGESVIVSTAPLVTVTVFQKGQGGSDNGCSVILWLSPVFWYATCTYIRVYRHTYVHSC